MIIIVKFDSNWAHKSFVTDKINEAGGQIFDDFSQCCTKRLESNIFLIASRPCNTRKYLMALGLGIPIISSTWIRDCLNQVNFIKKSNLLLNNLF